MKSSNREMISENTFDNKLFNIATQSILAINKVYFRKLDLNKKPNKSSSGGSVEKKKPTKKELKQKAEEEHDELAKKYIKIV